MFIELASSRPRGQSRLFRCRTEPDLQSQIIGSGGILVAASPSFTFSRARHGNMGPPVWRNSTWLRGCPDLRAGDQAKVDAEHLILDFIAELAPKAAEASCIVLVKVPEDLGRRLRGTPASIWRWLGLLQRAANLHRGAILVSDWSSSTALGRPTGLLTNANSLCAHVDSGQAGHSLTRTASTWDRCRLNAGRIRPAAASPSCQQMPSWPWRRAFWSIG